MDKIFEVANESELNAAWSEIKAFIGGNKAKIEVHREPEAAHLVEPKASPVFATPEFMAKIKAELEQSVFENSHEAANIHAAFSLYRGSLKAYKFNREEANER